MNREYTAELEKIEAVLAAFFPAAPDAAWRARIFPHLECNPALARELLAPGRDLFSRGGKRWRPLLAHILCRALGGGDAALPLLPLVEFCHNASLIHDDLEDNSDERRGKPAVHLLYGGDTAINSGSFLYFLPLAALENWHGGAEDKLTVWRLWAEHMRLLHLGQSMDIAWHRDPSFIPSLDEYMVMCGLKTGCLARFAALLGIEAARAAPENTVDSAAAQLAEAAQKLGVGFQILDDVKNLGAGIPGKKRGDDVVEGKKSLPVLFFLGADGTDVNGFAEANGSGKTDAFGVMNKTERAAFVARCFTAARKGGTRVPEVEEFIAALTQAGALEAAEQRGKALLAEAGTVFSSIKAADSAAGILLAALPEALVNAGS